MGEGGVLGGSISGDSNSGPVVQLSGGGCEFIGNDGGKAKEEEGGAMGMSSLLFRWVEVFNFRESLQYYIFQQLFVSVFVEHWQERYTAHLQVRFLCAPNGRRILGVVSRQYS